MKRFLSLSLTLLLLLGAVAFAASEPAAESACSVGDIVTFGRYEQDNDVSNGPEPIEWIVLEADGKTVMLLSRYGLDCRPYHDANEAVTWESCPIRQWLNGAFLEAAFTDEEQAQILTTIVTADRNPSYTNVDQGGDTRDRIALLSFREAKDHFASDQDRVCYPTAYALAQGVRPNTDTGACMWWLRTADTRGYNVVVPEDGWIRGGFDVRLGAAVRPVITVPLSVFRPQEVPGGSAVTMPLSDVVYELNQRFVIVRNTFEGSEAYEDTGRLVIAIYTSPTDSEPEILTSDSDALRGFPAEYLAESYETADRAAFIFPDYRKVGSYDKGGTAYQTMTCYTLVDLRSGGMTSRSTAITTDPPQKLSVASNGGVAVPTNGYGLFSPEAALEILAAQEAKNRG